MGGYVIMAGVEYELMELANRILEEIKDKG